MHAAVVRSFEHPRDSKRFRFPAPQAAPRRAEGLEDQTVLDPPPYPPPQAGEEVADHSGAVSAQSPVYWEAWPEQQSEPLPGLTEG
jgi:hypothetical protein